ncbi:hypothetical protein BV25DRAFT_1627708 [Artomyces pyxidatus]|uniref:Uncharacterized protein n=1 Tax=Artomyces pyxidatus TaxID=48021 RepID=A0ACB8SIG8_9AGAM|nr:hypothetical protein BV25DRAFT_1627708 [Artomyces pyxidatus]
MPFSTQKENFLIGHMPALPHPLAPISRLPPEVLAIIFESCTWAENLFSLRDHEGFPPEQIGWMKVSHVCRRWRQISLGHAALWSDINNQFMSQPLLDMMVQRSARHPASLSLNMSKLDTPHFLSLLNTQNMLWLQKINIYLPMISPSAQQQCFSQFILDFTKESNIAPVLESLTLQHEPRDPIPIRDHSQPPPSNSHEAHPPLSFVSLSTGDFECPV